MLFFPSFSCRGCNQILLVQINQHVLEEKETPTYSAYVTMVHGKEGIEAAPKKMPNQHLNMESTRKIDGVYDSFGGKLSNDGSVFIQNFAIRSYELGPDGRASLGSLIMRLQVAAIYFRFLFLSVLRSYQI